MNKIDAIGHARLAKKILVENITSRLTFFVIQALEMGWWAIQTTTNARCSLVMKLDGQN
jgi:hypothetical protein